ncbi:MAG: hypothetical protein FDX18_03485 [Chlorobium sp.]|nr:MAG: hypothetical protein FDX18_03485 [Chlorobium sp.]
MEQQNTSQKILNPIERAKLGLKVLSLPYEEAEEVIDAYVSQGDYDKASVDLFKDQVATQHHIQEKSAELISTGGQILRLVVSAVAKNWPKPPVEGKA